MYILCSSLAAAAGRLFQLYYSFWGICSSIPPFDFTFVESISSIAETETGIQFDPIEEKKRPTVTWQRNPI